MKIDSPDLDSRSKIRSTLLVKRGIWIWDLETRGDRDHGCGWLV